MMSFIAFMTLSINAQNVLDLPITSYSDDVEYFDASGNSDFWSSDIEMMYENGTFHYADALRFTGITIPSGSVVSKAYIQFTCKEVDSYPVSILIKADNVQDSEGFSETEDILARSLTDAVVWNPDGWDEVDRASEIERTSDLSVLLNTLLDNYGSFDDNAVSFILTTNTDSLDGVRTAYSKDGDADKAAVLHIEYSSGGGNYPQTVNTPFEPQTGVFSTTFDVTPMGSSLDAVVGLSDTEVTGWGSDMKAIFLFTADGKIKVYNGAASRGYEQLYDMSYEAGKAYHITMTVDVPNQKYSATIAPDGGDTLIMAYNYGFRAPASELNHWFVHSDSTEGTRLVVDDFTILDDVVDINFDQTVNTPFEPQTGVFSTTFDVKPLGTSLDAVVGLSDTEITGWGSDMKTIFLFTANGKIKVYNGARGYEQLYDMSYEAGKVYHITMTVDVPNKTYSATIAPDGEDTLIMAYDFGFRAEATELNHWFVHSDSAQGTRLLVDKFTIADDVIDINFAQTVNTPFEPQTGVFSTTFDVKPLGTSLDAVVGLSDTEITGWGSDMKAIFLFTDNGKIKAYNGSDRGYEQLHDMSYESGKVYHITMTVDVPNKTYSATIAPDGEDTLIMAYNFGFRAEATELNHWFVHSDSEQGTKLLVDQFKISDDVIDINFAQTVNTPFAPQTGVFTSTYNIKPLGSTLDAVVGLSNTEITGWGSDMKTIILFTDNGKIKVYDGIEGSYKQMFDMGYEAGMVFHVTMTVDVPNQTYSATITPDNGEAITMAYNFGFRAEAGELNSWFVHSDAETGTLLVVDKFLIEDDVTDILNNAELVTLIDSSRAAVDSAVVGTAPDEYSQETVDNANLAITAAQDALASATTQEEIDQATADLRAAMKQFVPNASSIEDILGANFRMYPNPVNNVLVLENTSKVNSLAIFNATGALVTSMNLSGNEISIDLSSLTPGIYFIRFNTANGIAAKRFIKQ